MPGRTRDVALQPEHVTRLQQLLDDANGRRAARRLSLEDVKETIEAALVAEVGFAWKCAGAVDDAREFTTACLVVVGSADVSVGIVAARAQDLTPDRAWPELGAWDRHSGAANVNRCLAWSGRHKPDRCSVPLTRPATSLLANEADLRAVIAERPLDFTTRRVFADFLSERGDPRGEFITVQLERLRLDLSVAEQEVLDARAQALLNAHQPAWVPVDLTGVEVQFRGGFVEELTIADPLAFERVAPLLEQEPVMSLRLLNHRGLDLARLGALPWVDRLRRLSFVRMSPRALSLTAETIHTVLESRRLRALERLDLIGHELSDVGALVLAANVPYALPALTALTLSDCDVGEVGAQGLASAKWLGALRQLDLSTNDLGPGGVHALAFAKSPGHLQSLTLDRTRMADEGALSLARAPRLATLRTLSATHARIGGLGCQALLESVHLRGLESLSLRGNAMGRKVQALAHARFPNSV